MSADRRIGPTDPGYWNGTLLKCPGCRLKFPFSATDHPFELRPSPGRNRAKDRPAEAPVTRCPQCQGWVALT